jgi:type VI protein secretion system component VasF
LEFRLSSRPPDGEETRAAAEARRAADARFRDSAAGMLETARDLLSNASQMSDTNDRKMMLRLAAEFERRAKEKRSRRF